MAHASTGITKITIEADGKVYEFGPSDVYRVVISHIDYESRTVKLDLELVSTELNITSAMMPPKQIPPAKKMLK